MGKSVIKSLIVGSLTVVLVSMLVVTVVFFYNVKSNIEDEAYEDMHACVEKINPVAQLAFDFSTSKMYMMFDASMMQFTNLTKYRFIICTESGKLMWTDLNKNVSELKPHIQSATMTISGKSTKRLAGVFDNIYGYKTITYAETIESFDGRETLIVFCTQQSPRLSSKYVDILLEVLVMEIAALLLLAIFLYFFSKNITSPLRKINKTIKEFSTGDFDKRVEYTSENELGELAQNVNVMAESIQNLERTRSAFISDVSHELRTPMTSISGFVEGIIDGTIPPENSAKYLKVVLSESKRLSRLVEDLLNVSRIDSGKDIIQKKSFNITELARIILLKFEADVTKKNISVYFESDSEEIYVYADKDSVTQILINLIHNAVKFTPHDGHIKIRLAVNVDKCIIYIENTGDGIDGDKLNLIWERFYKTDSSRSNDRSGVGLGLYIVKKLIDAHGETINVSSIQGESTTFSFTLELT